MRQRGFTLLELLIVLVVVTMLAALLVPVFSQARARARRNICVNNLRELARAVAMYAKDYDGCAPGVGYPFADQEWAGSWPRNPYVSWQTALAPYVRSRALFNCPDTTFYNTVDGTACADDMQCLGVAFPDSWRGTKLSYGFNVLLQFSTRMPSLNDLYNPNFPNSWFSYYNMSAGPGAGMDPATGWGGRNYSRLRKPAAVVLIADANNPTELCYDKVNLTDMCPDSSSPDCDINSLYSSADAVRHNGGNNWAFANGTVKWVPALKYLCRKTANGTGAGYTATDAEILSRNTLQKVHGIDQLN